MFVLGFPPKRQSKPPTPRFSPLPTFEGDEMNLEEGEKRRADDLSANEQRSWTWAIDPKYEIHLTNFRGNCTSLRRFLSKG
ncbi:MAG: hypothetical protein ACTS4V_00860 [Candidatus Hodgkinia cicadicola]